MQILILENGAYGRRQVEICKVLGISYHHESFSETGTIDPERVNDIMSRDGNCFSHVGIVHCETSSGVFNDVEAIGQIIKKYCPSKYVMVTE